jgi:hypothetical protein
MSILRRAPLFSCALALAACADPGSTAASSGPGGANTTASAATDGASSAASSVASSSSSASAASSGGAGAGGQAGCVDVDDAAPLALATAPAAGEYALALPATSASHTSWREGGNEALYLDVTSGTRAIGQMVLHQGHDGFTYTMALGHLAAGETVFARVSSLSSPGATRSACVGPASLTEAASMGSLGEALLHAPIFKWPVEKRFDDLPMLLGWSKAKKHYEAFYTNENGGTVDLCGGGADGMQAEFARWGRGADVEGMFNYGGATPTWERCTGTVGYDTVQLRTEGAHPIVYYGDGHTRLFESRGGYGQTCGTSGDKQADGDLQGWNVGNPGNAATLDEGYVVTLRPLPVALDPLGFALHSGRREGAIDHYAPWLYRVTDAEIAREGKIDGSKVQPMQNYLFVDVHVNDVDGSGDSYCSALGVDGGFKLRAVIAGGPTISGPQMTADYVGGQDAIKRIALPLGAAYQASDVSALVFDAYDDDGMYFLDLGDAFIAKPSGENGATLDYVHMGSTPVNRYVDDDSSNCTNGMNPDGPNPPYVCAGSAYAFTLP